MSEDFLSAWAANCTIKTEKRIERTLLKESATRWGTVCFGRDYETTDPEDLIPTAKGWNYERDLAKLQGRLEADAVSTRSFFNDLGLKSIRSFKGDKTLYELRLLEPTLIMLREFVKFKFMKEADDFVERCSGDLVDKKTGEVIKTLEEREKELEDSVGYQDCRDLRDDTEKLAKFRKFFGTATKVDVEKAMRATHGDTYYALIKAILRVDGTSAFARYAKRQYEKKITAEDIRSGKVDIKHAAREKVRADNFDNAKRVAVIHALQQQGSRDETAHVAKMINESKARVAAKREAVLA